MLMKVIIITQQLIEFRVTKHIKTKPKINAN